MAVRKLERENLGYFTERLARIRDMDQRRWGALDPAHLMAHLRTGLEKSLGEGEPVVSKGVPVVRTLLRWLFFHVFINWPPDKIKAPADWTPALDQTLDLEMERSRLLETMNRFFEEAERNPGRKTNSLMFGPLTLKYYRHLHGVHFRHHFRQYGIDD